MRRVFLMVVACLLLLAVVAAPSAACVRHHHQQPFRGCVSGSVVFTPDAASPSPTGLWTDSSATGRATHLGKVVMTSRHPTPTGTDITDGHMKLVGANGMEVWITYTGYAPFPVIGVPGTIVVDCDYQIVGGTGRFAHASGGGELTAYVEFPGQLTLGPWPAHWDWTGAIRF